MNFKQLSLFGLLLTFGIAVNGAVIETAVNSAFTGLWAGLGLYSGVKTYNYTKNAIKNQQSQLANPSFKFFVKTPVVCTFGAFASWYCLNKAKNRLLYQNDILQGNKPNAIESVIKICLQIIESDSSRRNR